MNKILVECGELLERLVQDYPKLKFRVGKKFMYRPPRTVYYEKFEQNNYCLQLLHEVGHAISGYVTYKTDVERVKIERAAWDEAAELCEKYGVDYDEEFVEAELDTYRDWLHQKSKCPDCQMTRYQDQNGVYHCPFCQS